MSLTRSVLLKTAGTASLIAHCEGADSAAVLITAQPSGGGAGGPHEPTGFTPMARYHFTEDPASAITSCSANGMDFGVRVYAWQDLGLTDVTRITDPTAPFGSTAWRHLVPAGTGDGQSSIWEGFYQTCSKVRYRRLYTRWAQNMGGADRHSYQGNSKIYMFPSAYDGNINIFCVSGNGTSYGFQFIRAVWFPNGEIWTNAGNSVRTTQRFANGQWLDCELLLANSSLDQHDATLELWVNGAKQPWTDWSRVGDDGAPLASGGASGLVTGFKTRTTLHPWTFPSARVTYVNGGGNGWPESGQPVDNIFDLNLIYVSGSNT